MGIFDFFKKRPVEKQENRPKKLNLDDVDKKIDSFSKEAIGNINRELENIKRNIEENINNIEKNINLLEEKEPKNKNLPERAKSVVEGNKKSYIVKLREFIKTIEMPEDVYSVVSFCDGFDSSLDDLGKKTIKNFNILQQFFGDETKSISIGINQINDLLKNSKKMIQDSNIEKIRELKESVKDVNNKLELKKEIEKEIKLANEKKEKNNNELKEKEKEIKNIEKGDNYKRFLDLCEKDKLLKKDLKELETGFSSDFLAITSSLKKYERLTMDFQLVNDYMKNHLKALQNDENLKIVGLLGKMSESIAKGELDLKDNKKKRILSKLSRFDKNYFEGFISKHKGLSKNVDELKSEIESIKEVENIKELKVKLKSELSRIEEDDINIKELQNKFDNINVEDMKKRISSGLTECVNEEFIVS